MTNLTGLTIITLSYNRQPFALRQMQFWSDHQVKMHLIDGSSTPINPELLKGINKNIHYHHEPCSYEERLTIAAKLVDTPYVINLSDDEFYVPSAVEKCIDQLKSNEKVVSCVGRCIGFFLDNGGVSAVPAYPEMKNYRIENETPIERMVAHAALYTPSTMYAVQRTEAWMNCTNLMAEGKGKFSSPYVSELEFELGTCYQGHAIVIEELMWLRNKRNPPVSIKQFNRKFEFSSWINDSNYQKEIDHFYDITSSTLSSIDGRDKQEVLLGLKQAIDAYLKGLKKPSLPVRVLAKILSGTLKRKIKGWKSLQDTIKRLHVAGVNIDFEQLKMIEEFIIAHPVELGIK